MQSFDFYLCNGRNCGSIRYHCKNFENKAEFTIMLGLSCLKIYFTRSQFGFYEIRSVFIQTSLIKNGILPQLNSFNNIYIFPKKFILKILVEYTSAK